MMFDELSNPAASDPLGLTLRQYAASRGRHPQAFRSEYRDLMREGKGIELPPILRRVDDPVDGTTKFCLPAGVTNPEWMVRDFQEAARAVQKSDFARAVGLLKTVLEDSKGRPVQQKADKLLKDLEQQAAARLAAARRLQDTGKSSEAAEALTSLVRDFAGTQTARDGLPRVNRKRDVPHRPHVPAAGLERDVEVADLK